ncbi:universal stress protein [Actinomyces sp. B33]|uniref:universal stress protein n=1 Tax=Actinomyces sp. B33 TaxID=2942131 RepID=UPI0023410E1E|nr:universal stress protein [Actinomyces sp. B33]MDC4232195.1 universal stress protein [Actinomyces sp. B33]
MGSTEVILVGVDGSTESLAAVSWAAGRAARTGARIHVLCTYALASYSAAALDGGYAILDDEALRRGAQQVVDEAVDHARAHGGSIVSGSIEPGDPAGVLVEMSREVDLVVVGSRGGGGFADRLLGTVSSALPAHAKCPVVIVPKHTSGKKFMPVERIVVGVDGSDVPSSALRRAIDEAQTWDARLTAVSAIPIQTGATMVAWMPTGADHAGLLRDVRKGMGAAIDEALAGRRIDVARHALDGTPSSLLVEFSTAVDLVVVGTRGRGGLAGVLLGSTSQTVISHSTCPVMVVPSDHLAAAESASAPDWERR